MMYSTSSSPCRNSEERMHEDGVQQESLVGLRPKEDIIAYINTL